MPFGLCNAPSTFQRLMEITLAGLHWVSCLVYLDDIIIFGNCIQEHFQRLEEVLSRLLHKAGLKLKPKECHLFQKSVKYLGQIISNTGVQTDPDKIDVIKSWPIPAHLEDLRKFLGISSYYRKFISNFATIAAPLYKLTGKTNNWNWSLECQNAFATLKLRLSSPPILATGIVI